jgi:hypothetical protein
MNTKILSPLSPEHEKYEAYAAKVKELADSGNHHALAELLTGLIQGAITLDDPVAGVLGGEFNWADVTGMEQLFLAPIKVTNNRAITMENGALIPTARIVRNRVSAPFEEIASPAYEIDVRTLKRGDVATLADIQAKAAQSLIVEKTLRLYKLLGSGADMTETDSTLSRVVAIEDDGEFSSATDAPTYVRLLKRKIRTAISQLAEACDMQGVTISGMTRAATLDLIADTAVTGVTWTAIPAAADEDSGRAYFTDGDIILVAPYAANCARVMDVEGATKQKPLDGKDN